MAKTQKHVVPSTSGGWAVRNSNSVRASKLFPTQDAAVSYAREAAKRERTELFVHGRDGMIKERNSYGRDPLPPRDKK
jgi:hypothetical protein